MAPNYWHGQIVIALKFTRPKVGDVVIARHNKLELIKRVDQLEQDQVYLLGDNPEESVDSREYGWLPVTSVIGVVIGK